MVPRGPAGRAPTEGSGHRILERPQHWVATPARSGWAWPSGGGRLACLIPGPPPCPAPSLLAPPGHVFLARSGPSSILIAIIPCNGVGWRLLCGGPEQHTPLRGPVWGAWRLGTRGSQRLPAMVSILVYERALSSGALCQLAVDIAEKAGRSRSHHTRRNSQSRCDVSLTSCPAALYAYAGAGDSYVKAPLWGSVGMARV